MHTGALRRPLHRLARASQTAFLLAAVAALGQTPSPMASQKAGYSGHGAGSASAEILAKYAPPALPPSLSARIQAMLDVRSPGAGWSRPTASACTSAGTSPGRSRCGGWTAPSASPSS